MLMVRPAAMGRARRSMPSRTRSACGHADFAKKVSASGGDDVIAETLHLAMYTIVFSKPDPLTSGAVWLNEPVKDRAEGIEHLGFSDHRNPRRGTPRDSRALRNAAAAVSRRSHAPRPYTAGP